MLPGGRTATVKDVLLADKSLSEGRAGQSVTLTLREDVDISRDDVIVGDCGAASVSQTAQAHLFWMSGAPLKRGTPYFVKLGFQTIAAQVSEIHHKVDIIDYAKIAADSVSANDVAFVSIVFDRPLATTGYRNCRELGGLILIDRMTNDTVVLGLLE